MPIAPFHLAIQVDDLTTARAFYGSILGCSEGRSTDVWVDFNFYGHQLTCHAVRKRARALPTSQVDGEVVLLPHFGVVLDWQDWQALAERLEAVGVEFLRAPGIRFQGQVGEQATMFFADYSGNTLEFKAFSDISRLFAE